MSGERMRVLDEERMRVRNEEMQVLKEKRMRILSQGWTRSTYSEKDASM